jgi:hypothetical protein
MRVPLRAVNCYTCPFVSPVRRSLWIRHSVARRPVGEGGFVPSDYSIKIRSMPKLPSSDTPDVESSESTVDFPNASLFRAQRQESDQFAKAMFIGLAIVLLVFLGSMIAVLMMHAPRL